MRPRVKMGLGMALLVVTSCHGAIAQSTALVSVSAHEETNGHVALTFNLKNCGRKDILMYYGDLPWHQSYTTVAVFVGVGQFAAEIPGVSVLADYPAHLVRIKPGEHNNGVMDLNIYFPLLGKVKDKSDLVIFWSYELHASNSNAKELFGGVITLGKGAATERSCGSQLGGNSP